MPVLTTKPEEIASFRDWLHAEYAHFSAQRLEAIQRMKTAQGDDWNKAAADFQLYNQHAEETHSAIRLLALYCLDHQRAAHAPADGKRSAAAGEGATALPVLTTAPLGNHGEMSSPAHA